MRRWGTESRGLTMVELMAVIAVSSLLLGGAWRLVYQSMHTYKQGLQEIRLTQRARSSMRTFVHDLQRVSTGAAQRRLHGSSESGEAAQITLVTRPETMLAAGPHTSGMPASPQQIRYFLKPATPDGPFVLQRAVIAPGTATGERITVLHEHVQALSLRYFDGHIWHKEWQHDDLPRAVEIAMTLQDGQQPTRTYRLATVVPFDL